MSTILLNVENPVAEVTNQFLGTGNLYSDLLLIVLLVVMLIIFIAVSITLKALRTMLQATMPELVKEEKEQKILAKAQRKEKRRHMWEKVMGLHKMSEEKDLLIDHEYDGIKELDNPIPIWFNAMFYASVAFAVVYLLVYHVFGWGLNQDQEYVREMALAEKERQEWLAQAANNIDETNVEVDLRPEVISAGMALYTLNCAVCHGGAGEGGIGPNMTDEYWIHGGEIEDIFRIVKYGVLDKGMVPWEQSMTPGQIAEVSNYILSLRGTNPPNPKEPQGDKVEYRSEGAEATAEEGAEQENAEASIEAGLQQG